jgi:2-keto-4-pentenoate hydratase
LIQPRIEAELAFVLDRDLEGPGVTTAKALSAIAGVLPALACVFHVICRDTRCRSAEVPCL